jgi:hypothetical protein
MTAPASPQPHCDHECVCHDMTNTISEIDAPCNNQYCKHDTRTHPHTPAPHIITMSDLAAYGTRVSEFYPEEGQRKAREEIAHTATLAETQRIYGLFHEVEMLHLNGMAYPDLYNEMVARIKFIHTEPLSKDGRKKK